MSIFKKKIPKKYLGELQKRGELQRSFALIAKLVAGNTSLIPKGQDEAKKYQVIAELLTQDNNEYFAKVLLQSGFELKGKIYDIRNDGTVIELPTPPPSEPPK